MRDRQMFGVFDSRGFRVHTCKSKSDAFRVAAKFDREDGIRHHVEAITCRQERTL